MVRQSKGEASCHGAKKCGQPTSSVFPTYLSCGERTQGNADHLLSKQMTGLLTQLNSTRGTET